MALWIDRPAWPAHDTLFSHLVSDGGLESTGTCSWVRAAAEVREAVAASGLHEGWVDGDHADVPASSFELLVAAGARLQPAREITAMLEATGQRLRKRKGDKCLRRVVLDEERRVDVVRSAVPPRPVETRAVVLDARGRVLLQHDGGWNLPPGAEEDGRPVGFAEHVQRDPAEPSVLHREHVAYRLVPAGEVAPAARSGSSRWVSSGELETLCGDALWWPLVRRGLDRGWGA